MKTYDAERQGFWKTRGGNYEAMVDRYQHISKVYGLDRRSTPYFEPEPETPVYEEGKSYTKQELSLMADAILYEDGWWDGRILNQDTLRDRLKREVFVGPGVPDPSIVSGMYWRTHPQGRPWWSEEERRERRASFYR